MVFPSANNVESMMDDPDTESELSDAVSQSSDFEDLAEHYRASASPANTSLSLRGKRSRPIAIQDDNDTDSESESSPVKKRKPGTLKVQGLVAVEKLPAEILQQIATLPSLADVEFSALSESSPVLASRILSPESSVWRQRFLSQYDYPLISNPTQETFHFAYQIRQAVLRQCIAFNSTNDARIGHQLDVLKDMVLETFNPPASYLPRPEISKNLTLFSSPELATWMTSFLSTPLFFAPADEQQDSSSRRSGPQVGRKQLQFQPLFHLLHLTLTPLLLSPLSPQTRNISAPGRSTYSMRTVYNYNAPFTTLFTRLPESKQDLDPSPPWSSPAKRFNRFPNLRKRELVKYKLDLDAVISIRNFWWRHLMDSGALIIEDEYWRSDSFDFNFDASNGSQSINPGSVINDDGGVSRSANVTARKPHNIAALIAAMRAPAAHTSPVGTSEWKYGTMMRTLAILGLVPTLWTEPLQDPFGNLEAFMGRSLSTWGQAKKQRVDAQQKKRDVKGKGKAREYQKRPLDLEEGEEGVVGGGKWIGHYACLSPWPKNNRDMEELQSNGEMWDQLCPLILDFTTSTTDPSQNIWPPLFREIPVFKNTIPNPDDVDVEPGPWLYLRGIAPFFDITSAIEKLESSGISSPNNNQPTPSSSATKPPKSSQSSKTKHETVFHPFLSLRLRGIIHPLSQDLAATHPIPGTRRIVFVLYKPCSRSLVQTLEHDQENFGDSWGVAVSSLHTGSGNGGDGSGSGAGASNGNGNGSTGQGNSANFISAVDAEMHLQEHLKNSLAEKDGSTQSQQQDQQTQQKQNPKEQQYAQWSKERIAEMEDAVLEGKYLSWDEMEYAYGYEGVIVPGGRLILGRWWRLGAVGEGEGMELDCKGETVIEEDDDEVDAGVDAGMDGGGDGGWGLGSTGGNSSGSGGSGAETMVDGVGAGNSQAVGTSSSTGAGIGTGVSAGHSQTETTQGKDPRQGWKWKGLERGPFMFWPA